MRGFSALLTQIQENLLTAEARWCLIGGLAVATRTEPRFTKDLDLAVDTDNDQASEQLIFTLQAAGYRVLAILEQQVTGRLATVRLAPPNMQEPVILDLLFASSGIESEVVQRAEVIEVFPQVRVPVACLGDLIAMKVLARDDRARPQDRLDLKVLLQQAGPADLQIARQALQEIADLGYARERFLLGELALAQGEFL